VPKGALTSTFAPPALATASPDFAQFSPEKREVTGSTPVPTTA